MTATDGRKADKSTGGYPSPKVAVVILNLNRANDTIACIESVLKSGGVDLRVVVLDNGSSGDDAERISRLFKDKVDVLRVERNKGVAAGWNVALHHTLEHHNPDFVFLLNNDTIIEPTVISELTVYAANSPNAGIFGPNIIEYTYPKRDKLVPLKQSSQPTIDFVLSGSAMMVRRAVFDSIGYFDEDYFAYGEENDFTERLRDTEWVPMYVPTKGTVLHKGGSTSSMMSGFEVYHRSRNGLVFAAKNLTGKRARLWLLRDLFRSTPKGLVQDLRHKERWSRVRNRVRGTASGLLSYPNMRAKAREARARHAR